MTLATVGFGNRSHSAAVYFVSDDGFNLYFYSDEKSQHTIDIKENPYCSAVIYPVCWGVEDIKGLQLRGVVNQVIALRSVEFVWTIYTNKFPFVNSMRRMVDDHRLYQFSPDWIRMIDNSIAFGYKKEWTRVPNSSGALETDASSWTSVDDISSAGGVL